MHPSILNSFKLYDFVLFSRDKNVRVLLNFKSPSLKDQSMHSKVRKCKFQRDFSNQTFPSLNT